MPPKKAVGKKGDKGKGKGKGKDGEVDVVQLVRKVKVEMGKALVELGISPELELDKFLVSKIQEALLAEPPSTKLVFTGEKPGPLGVQLLTAVLRELTPTVLNFKSLCFWKALLGEDGLRYMCMHLLPIRKNELLKWPGFVNLELIDCKITPQGCEYLSEALRCKEIPLLNLNLDFNPIGDQGVTNLAEGLRRNKDLAMISMGYCRIGPAGGAVIGEEVLRSCNLKRIRLPGNRIMDAGMAAIAKDLGKIQTLVELDLADNSISGDMQALNALCEGMRTNMSLETMNIEGNSIDNEGAMLLMETLAMCPKIAIFRISGQGIDKAVYTEVFRDGKKKKGKGKGKKGGKKKKK